MGTSPRWLRVASQRKASGNRVELPSLVIFCTFSIKHYYYHINKMMMVILTSCPTTRQKNTSRTVIYPWMCLRAAISTSSHSSNKKGKLSDESHSKQKRATFHSNFTLPVTLKCSKVIKTGKNRQNQVRLCFFLKLKAPHPWFASYFVFHVVLFDYICFIETTEFFVIPSWKYRWNDVFFFFFLVIPSWMYPLYSVRLTARTSILYRSLIWILAVYFPQRLQPACAWNKNFTRLQR